MVHVNLLPWRQRRRDRQRRMFCMQLLAVSAVAATLVAGAEVHIHGLIEQQRQRNGQLERRNAELDAEIAALDVLNRGAEEVAGRVRVLQALWAERSTTLELFDQLAHSAVAGLHFVALSRRSDALTVRGAAESNDRVAALMRNLRDTPHFAAPHLKTIDADQGLRSATFELVFALVPNDAQEALPE